MSPVLLRTNCSILQGLIFQGERWVSPMDKVVGTSHRAGPNLQRLVRNLWLCVVGLSLVFVACDQEKSKPKPEAPPTQQESAKEQEKPAPSGPASIRLIHAGWGIEDIAVSVGKEQPEPWARVERFAGKAPMIELPKGEVRFALTNAKEAKSSQRPLVRLRANIAPERRYLLLVVGDAQAKGERRKGKRSLMLRLIPDDEGQPAAPDQALVRLVHTASQQNPIDFSLSSYDPKKPGDPTKSTPPALRSINTGFGKGSTWRQLTAGTYMAKLSDGFSRKEVFAYEALGLQAGERVVLVWLEEPVPLRPNQRRLRLDTLKEPDPQEVATTQTPSKASAPSKAPK